MQTQQPQKVEPTKEQTTRGWLVALAAAAVVLVVAGVISLLSTSGGAEPASEVPITTTTVAALVETPTTVAPAPPKIVQIEAFDYGYSGFDVEIVAGDALELFNGSETEFHNLVVIRLGDDDSRTVVEIAEISAEDIAGGWLDRGSARDHDRIATSVGHLDAAPGEGAFNGRIRLQTAGRYIALDMIAQGADPLTVRSAVETFAPPYLVAGGPLGYQHGMIVEFFVIEK